MEQYKTIVIGAGPAGLAAANELAKRGVKTLVLEQGDRPGGLARTEVYKGYRFDIGGHRFYTKNREVQQLWREMLGDDLLTVPRQSRIYYKRRFFNYPLTALNTVTNLGPVESSLIILSYAWARVRPTAKEETFEEWVTNRFGGRLFRTFFKTYTEKVWGIPCDVLRADWAAQRIGKLSVTAAIKNALFGGNSAKTLISEFLYPALGPGMMWERFQESITTNGGRVLLNSAVVRLNHENGSIKSVMVRNGGEPVEIRAESFVSSMPLCDLVAGLRPEPPEDVLRAAAGLKYRDFILVALVVNQPKLFSDNWIYIHAPDVRVGRIQNFRNWSSAMVAEKGKCCLGMEYFCFKGDDLWSMGDFRLCDLAADELAALGLAVRSDVEDAAVVRQEKAYPVYDSEYHRNLQIIRQYLATFGNLQSIGRNGMHRYNNQDHSMLAGLLAARNLLGERHELWSVNTDLSYGETVAEGMDD